MSRKNDDVNKMMEEWRLGGARYRDQLKREASAEYQLKRQQQAAQAANQHKAAQSGQNSTDDGAIAAFVLCCLAVPILLGMVLRLRFSTSIVQGAVLIWTITIAIVGILYFCRTKGWIPTKTILLYSVGGVLAFALLMSIGLSIPGQ